MKLSYSKFILGNWVLRATNDNYLNSKNAYTYIIISDNNNIKLKSIYNEGFITVKKSTTGIFNIIDTDINNNNNNNNNTDINNNTNNNNIAYVDVIYNKYNIYSHSLFGIQLPEIKSENKIIMNKRRIKVELIDGSILVNDDKTPLYYLFDLQIGKIKSPFIEIYFNTFIFSQIFSLLLSSIINHL